MKNHLTRKTVAELVEGRTMLVQSQARITLAEET